MSFTLTQAQAQSLSQLIRHYDALTGAAYLDDPELRTFDISLLEKGGAVDLSREDARAAYDAAEIWWEEMQQLVADGNPVEEIVADARELDGFIIDWDETEAAMKILANA